MPDAPPLARTLGDLLVDGEALEVAPILQSLRQVVAEIGLLRLEALGEDVRILTKSLEGIPVEHAAVDRLADRDGDLGEAAQMVRQALAATSIYALAGPLETAVSLLSNPGDLHEVVQAVVIGRALGRPAQRKKRLKVRYPMQTKTGDDKTHASDPGGVQLSLVRLWSLVPALRDPPTWGERVRAWFRGEAADAWKDDSITYVREHLLHGDSRAAVVVALRPRVVVACYTDELDCVALVAFEPSEASRIPDLRVGTRLLTVNRYRWLEEGLACDLWQGERAFERYGNFIPIVADLLSADATRLKQRKAEIDEAEWLRCERLGELLHRSRQRPRDGRPYSCQEPGGRLVVPRAELVACAGRAE